MLIINQMVIFLKGKSTTRIPTGFSSWNIIFLIYVNDLSKTVSDKPVPNLFADDTSFIIANCDETEFKFNTNEIFTEINK